MKRTQLWGVRTEGVYLLKALEGPLWKIGMSLRVKGRLRQVYKTQRPCELIHVVTTNDPYALEHYLHRAFRRRLHHEPAHREWFTLWPVDVHRFMALTHVDMNGKLPADKAVRAMFE